MNIVSLVSLKLEGFEKCHMQCDTDCPLGVLYDYSCALQSFLTSRMLAAQEAQKAKVETEEPQVAVCQATN